MMDTRQRSSIMFTACVLGCLALSGCGGSPDAYSGPPGAMEAASDGAGAGASAPVRARVPDDAQFAIDELSVEDFLALPASASCSLENLVSMSSGEPSPGEAPNSYVARRGDAYKLIGFATDSESGTVPGAVRVFLLGGSVYAVDAVAGFSRPDVAAYFKVAAFAMAGFQADAGFDDVTPGEYRVFIHTNIGSRDAACPTHQTVVVH